MFCDDNKRFKPNSVFDLSLNPVPKNLRLSLDYISERFYNTQNLHALCDTKETRLYGLMTSYVGKNFCWIQPSQVKSFSSDYEYDQYVRAINKRNVSQIHDQEIKVGMDCIARYEADSHWYRAIVVKELPQSKWLVVFIDYGNFQICESKQIGKPIVEENFNHFNAPTQAICCRLYNIVPKLPYYREDIDLYLKRYFEVHSSKFVEVVVRSIRQDNVVDCDIFLPKSKTTDPDRLYRRHIGQELLESGLASFADPIAARAIRAPGYPVSQNKPILMEFTEQQDTSSFVDFVK